MGTFTCWRQERQLPQEGCTFGQQRKNNGKPNDFRSLRAVPVNSPSNPKVKKNRKLSAHEEAKDCRSERRKMKTTHSQTMNLDIHPFIFGSTVNTLLEASLPPNSAIIISLWALGTHSRVVFESSISFGILPPIIIIIGLATLTGCWANPLPSFPFSDLLVQQTAVSEANGNHSLTQSASRMRHGAGQGLLDGHRNREDNCRHAISRFFSLSPVPQLKASSSALPSFPFHSQLQYHQSHQPQFLFKLLLLLLLCPLV